jgi:ABC-type transport system involved in Fe-S cluster assembly fused permease/ATPase subunit
MLAYTVFTLRVTSWRTKFRKEMNAAENLASHLAFDSLSHQETVKQFRGEAHEARRYEGALRAYETASRETAASLALLNVGQQAIVTAALGGVMWMTISNILGGSGSIGDLVLVNGLILQLSLPLNFLGSVYRELRQAIVDVEGLLSLRAVEPEINSPDKPVRRVDGSTEIRFEQVGFHYPEDPNRSVLNGLSFTVPAGATVGIVGPSGCGKSTVARLLTRIVEPSAGQIRLGGVPIGQLALGELRAAFGVVPQDTALFNESLAYNIAYGRPDATMEEIRRAAVLAQIDELAMRLPQGYETRVGERGVVLSGGERQRVALARALLLDPPILILDEATSALDSRTEQQVIRSLCESSKRRTVIMIAHRLSTVADADLILVIGPNGCLAEFGTHQSLVAKEGGSYRELWMAQQRDKENSGDDVD